MVQRRKWVAALACFLAFCCMFSCVSAWAFQDVKQSDWYAEAVAYCSERGYMNGMGNNKFEPNGTVTRAQVAQVFYNIRGKGESTAAAVQQMPFKDVAKDAWYAAPIAWCWSKGIVNGDSPNTFSPTANITREQLAVMFRNAENSMITDNMLQEAKTFKDWADVSFWAQDAMAWAIYNGIINGTGNKVLTPRATAPRCQLAQILMNYTTNFGDRPQYGPDNNPLLAKNKPVNHGAAPSFDLDTTGFVKGDLKIKDLRGKTLNMITPTMYGLFSYTNEQGEKISEFEWFDSLKSTYGLNIKYVKSRFDKSVAENLTYMKANKPLDVIPTHAGGFPKYLNLSAPLDPYLDLKYLANSPGVDVMTLDETRWGGSYRCISPLGAVNVLWYNETMCEEFGLQDPHKLWQEGKWDWDAWRFFIARVPQNTLDGKPLTAYQQSTSELFSNWALTNGKNAIEIDTSGRSTPGLINNWLDADVLDSWAFLSGVFRGIRVNTGNYNDLYKGTLMMGSPTNLMNSVDIASDNYAYSRTHKFNWVPYPKSTTGKGQNAAVSFGYTMMLPKVMKNPENAPYAVKFMELWASRFTEAINDYLQTTEFLGFDYEARKEYFTFAAGNTYFGVRMNEWDMLEGDDLAAINRFKQSFTDISYNTVTEANKTKNIVDKAIQAALSYGI